MHVRQYQCDSLDSATDRALAYRSRQAHCAKTHIFLIPLVALPSIKTDKRLEDVDLAELMKRFE